MAEAPQAAPAADSGVGDGALDTTEQAQFDAMRDATSAPPAPAPEPVASPAPTPDSAAAPGAIAAPAAEPVAEVDEDDDGETPPAVAPKPGDPAKQGGRVSRHKYLRDTAKLETQVADLNKKIEDGTISRAKIEERLALINEALMSKPEQTAQAAEDPEPDPEKDIFAHNAWLKRRLDGVSTKLNEITQGTEAQQRAQQEEAHLTEAFTDDALTFAEAEPTFPEAYRYLINSRIIELAQFHFGINLRDKEAKRPTPKQVAVIERSIAAEERDLVKHALEEKRSPAQAVMALAMGRGFVAQAPKPTAAAPTNGAAAPAAPGSLASPPPAPAALAAVTSVADEIGRIKAGTEAALTLSAGGGAPPSALTPERLANMPDSEFQALMDRLTPAQQRAALGGG